MKLHPRFDHPLPYISYWSERSQIPLRINFGVLNAGETLFEEPLHYHKTRTTYFCVLSGSLRVEVDGKEIEVTRNAAVEIEPLEKYRVLTVGTKGCSWVVIGSHNEDDRVEA